MYVLTNRHDRSISYNLNYFRFTVCSLKTGHTLIPPPTGIGKRERLAISAYTFRVDGRGGMATRSVCIQPYNVFPNFTPVPDVSHTRTTTEQFTMQKKKQVCGSRFNIFKFVQAFLFHSHRWLLLVLI